MLQIAKGSGQRPSEIAGITCEYCAWCFDEALHLRQSLRDLKAHQRAEAEQHISQLSNRMRGAA